jgi:peptide/nickel transport system permease protein
MSVYIVKRLLLAIPTLLIVAIIVFFSIRLIPGDVIDLMLAEQYAGSTPYDRPRLEHELGLDVPIYIQFGRWIGFLSTPDEGYNGILQGTWSIPQGSSTHPYSSMPL